MDPPKDQALIRIKRNCCNSNIQKFVQDRCGNRKQICIPSSGHCALIIPGYDDEASMVLKSQSTSCYQRNGM